VHKIQAPMIVFLIINKRNMVLINKSSFVQINRSGSKSINKNSWTKLLGTNRKKVQVCSKMNVPHNQYDQKYKIG